MVDRLCLAPQYLLEIAALHSVGAGVNLGATVWIKCARSQDLAGNPDALEQGLEGVRVAQIARLDARGVVGTARSQAQFAAASRPQRAGVDREPVAGEPVAPMVIELRGQKMQLNVR